MAVFVWEGKAQNGKVVKGEMEAANAQAVFNQLRGKKIVPNVKKIRAKGSGLDKEINIPGF